MYNIFNILQSSSFLIDSLKENKYLIQKSKRHTSYWGQYKLTFISVNFGSRAAKIFMVKVCLVSLFSVITVFELTGGNFGFTNVFFTLSLFPTLLCLVSGWQEHRKALLLNLYSVIIHTRMHKTHPRRNKHNPPRRLFPEWRCWSKITMTGSGVEMCVSLCMYSMCVSSHEAHTDTH